jgi:hypothetical protein
MTPSNTSETIAIGTTKVCGYCGKTLTRDTCSGCEEDYWKGHDADCGYMQGLKSDNHVPCLTFDERVTQILQRN